MYIEIEIRSDLIYIYISLHCDRIFRNTYVHDYSQLFIKLKILGTGEIKKNIVISAHFASKQALTKIEKAGGKIRIIKK